MIAHLRGKLLVKHPNQAIVETAGVGYDVTISVPTFSELPARGCRESAHRGWEEWQGRIVRCDVSRCAGCPVEVRYYFPMQNVLKIRLRMSSVVVAPVMASSGRSPL